MWEYVKNMQKYVEICGHWISKSEAREKRGASRHIYFNSFIKAWDLKIFHAFPHIGSGILYNLWDLKKIQAPPPVPTEK